MTRRRDGEAGLSLVEVLVVLAIVAVLAGASVLGFGAAGSGVRVEAEAQRLADRLQLAADEALVTGVPLALLWRASGYRFVAWSAEAGGWRPAAPPPLGRAHALPGPLALSGEDGRAEGSLLILPEMAQAPLALRLGDGARRWRVRFDGFAAEAEPDAP